MGKIFVIPSLGAKLGRDFFQEHLSQVLVENSKGKRARREKGREQKPISARHDVLASKEERRYGPTLWNSLYLLQPILEHQVLL